MATWEVIGVFRASVDAPDAETAMQRVAEDLGRLPDDCRIETLETLQRFAVPPKSEAE